LLATVGALAACESADVGDGSAVVSSAAPRSDIAPFDVGPVKTAAEYLTDPAFAAADPSRGELLGLACAACHHFRAEQGALIGPNLQGVFGRPAGTVPGFAYSPALSRSGLIWTPRSLEAWLADPASFIAGTTMAFTGYRSPEDRRDLIAYLLRATQ
jgi:cytochrome c